MTLTNYVKIHSLTSLFCLSLMIASLFWTKHEQNLAQDERLNAAFVENETRHLLQLLTDKETGQEGICSRVIVFFYSLITKPTIKYPLSSID